MIANPAISETNDRDRAGTYSESRPEMYSRRLIGSEIGKPPRSGQKSITGCNHILSSVRCSAVAKENVKSLRLRPIKNRRRRNAMVCPISLPLPRGKRTLPNGLSIASGNIEPTKAH